MDILDEDLIKLVNALLAGFVASWVFYGLTPHPKASPFERVIQALIFTAFVQVPLALVRWLVALPAGYLILGYWTTSVELTWSVAIALIFGFAVSVAANKGQPHKFLSRRNWTKRTAYPSEWANAFHADREHDNCRATLHLRNGRRLYGWVLEFPDQPTQGHFRISDAVWFTDDRQIQPLECAEALIAGEDVEFVEFDALAKDETESPCGTIQSDAEDSSARSDASSVSSELTATEPPLEPDLSSEPLGACPDRM